MTAYNVMNMAGASPATIDFVLRNTINTNGGNLVSAKGEPPAPADGAMIYCLDGKIWTKRANGGVNLANGCQNAISAPVTVANSTDEDYLAVYPIPAYEAVAGSVYKLYFWGTYSVTGTPALTFTARHANPGDFTGIALASIPPVTAGSGVTDLLFEATAVMGFYSPVLAQASLKVEFGISDASDAARTYLAAPVTANGSTVATYVEKWLSVTLTWSAADPANTLSVLGGYGQRIA